MLGIIRHLKKIIGLIVLVSAVIGLISRLIGKKRKKRIIDNIPARILNRQPMIIYNHSFSPFDFYLLYIPNSGILLGRRIAW